MDALKFGLVLQALLETEQLLNDEGDGESIMVETVRTYEEANVGLVVDLTDGSQYLVTVARTR